MEVFLENLVVRPVRRDDLDGLQQIANVLHGSLTSLPKDREFLNRRITESLRAFDPLIQAAGSDNYLFVLEDVAQGVILGVSGILARIGGFEPFYSYRIHNESVRHDALGIGHEVRVLHLERSHKGPSEVCSLLLRPDYRGKHLGRLLSMTRFLFMAAYSERFEPTVIAEIRGFVDENGDSPFWDAVGRTFFEQDFQTADLWSGLGHKQFIEDLMPRYPIYIPLLPKAAQEAIGKPHPRAQAAAAILMSEGFTRTRQVDIFDAGPLLQAPLKGIRTVSESRAAKARVAGAPIDDEVPGYLVARPDLDFRCCLTAAREEPDGGLTLPERALELLEVEIGGTVLFAPFHKKALTQ